MAVGRANYNSTASAGTTKQVAPQNASRTSFHFKSLGDTFVLNFGSPATADNVLTVDPNSSVDLTSIDPYDIRAQINVYCAAGSAFQAQAEEMAVNP